MSEVVEQQVEKELEAQNTKETQDVSKEDKIEYAKYRSLLDEKKKIQAEKEAIAKERAEFETRLKAIEESKLLEEKRYKELFENRDKELASLKQKLELEAKAYAEAKKVEAFLRASGGLKNSSYKKFIDTSKILISNDGEVDENTLKDYVTEFTNSFGELLVKKDIPKLPENAPKIEQKSFANMSSKEILASIYK